MKNVPDCYECVHRHPLIGDAHSTCDALKAKVTGNERGKKSGWFFWPVNFDPVWLTSCDGFERKGR